MQFILWMSIVPIVWAILARFVFKNSICWKESGIIAGVGVLLLSIGYAIMMMSATDDVEILNGQVTGKEKVRVSCSHSYTCNCVTSCTGSGANQSCSTICQTCYEHSHDFDWRVATTVGKLEINRVDRQGTEEPPRWTAVQIGEPAAVENSYTNYLKAAPNSLFDMKLAESEIGKYNLPPVNGVYDYYRYDPVIDLSGKVTNVKQWNAHLRHEMRRLGPLKQVNVVVVFVPASVGIEYASTLERARLGGKKNEVTIVIGVEETKIEWVQSFTFGRSSGNGAVNVNLREDLIALGTTSNPAAGVAAISSDVRSYFVRREMKDYEYLKNEIRPTPRGVGTLMFLQLLLLSGITFFMHRHDTFTHNTYQRFRHPSINFNTRRYR